VDQEGEGMTAAASTPQNGAQPILEARGLVKRYGHVTALAGSDFDLLPGEVLAVIGDNGAGKSSLIKCLSGAVIPDEGEIKLEGKPIHMRTPIDARAHGIETVYQTLAVSPSLDIADNLFLGREPRAPGILGKVFRKLDRGRMRAEAKQQMTELGIMTIQDISQQVESLSGGQRQGVAVARAAAFGSKVIILDEPTAALGVKESAHVLELILKVRDSGIPVILISHNMPHVFEVADRIHIHRLGKRIAVVTPKSHTMNEVVAIMTGAAEPGYEEAIKEARHDAEVEHAAGTLKSSKDS
jgi:fructose transport system ATP-binding protein